MAIVTTVMTTPILHREKTSVGGTNARSPDRVRVGARPSPLTCRRRSSIFAGSRALVDWRGRGPPAARRAPMRGEIGRLIDLVRAGEAPSSRSPTPISPLFLPTPFLAARTPLQRWCGSSLKRCAAPSPKCRWYPTRNRTLRRRNRSASRGAPKAIWPRHSRNARLIAANPEIDFSQLVRRAGRTCADSAFLQHERRHQRQMEKVRREWLSKV